MEIEKMSLTEIEKYLKGITNENTNLMMRCINCDEYYPICDMNIDLELCNNCDEEE